MSLFGIGGTHQAPGLTDASHEAAAEPAQQSDSLFGLHIPTLPGLPSIGDVRAKIGALANRVLGGDTAAQIGWLQKSGAAPSKDLTQRFGATYAAAAAGKNVLPPDAKNYHYLTVGGLFTQHYPGYAKDNIETMRDQGLDVNEIPIRTDASVQTNAKQIRDAIMAASADGKPVVLLGHSKGGVDITAALAEYPELKSHVRAVVAAQTPYGGSPVANDVVHDPGLKCIDNLANRVIGAFGGTPESLDDLTYDKRQAFVGAHPYPSDIPTLAIGSTSDSPLSELAAISGTVEARYGVKSDGLVAAPDAEIPGTNIVHLQGLDHAGGVMKGLPGATKYDPAPLTLAAISMALSLPQTNASLGAKKS